MGYRTSGFHQRDLMSLMRVTNGSIFVQASATRQVDDGGWGDQGPNACPTKCNGYKARTAVLHSYCLAVPTLPGHFGDEESPWEEAQPTNDVMCLTMMAVQLEQQSGAVVMVSSFPARTSSFAHLSCKPPAAQLLETTPATTDIFIFAYNLTCIHINTLCLIYLYNILHMYLHTHVNEYNV